MNFERWLSLLQLISEGHVAIRSPPRMIVFGRVPTIGALAKDVEGVGSPQALPELGTLHPKIILVVEFE